MISETFVYKGDTPRKLRYESEKGQQSAYGGLYICKKAFGGRVPERIQVTMEELL
jgi:hypothetical protein